MRFSTAGGAGIDQNLGAEEEEFHLRFEGVGANSTPVPPLTSGCIGVGDKLLFFFLFLTLSTAS